MTTPFYRLFGLLGSIGIGLIAQPAMADRDHYLNFHYGDRATGMAGAFTALANDASGMYYNPAGIVDAESTAAATYNSFFITTVDHQRFADGIDWTSRSNVSLPGMLGITRNFGDIAIGGVFMVEDSVAEDQRMTRYLPAFEEINDSSNTTVSSNNRAVAFSRLNEYDRYILGPSLAWRINDRWMLGGSLLASYLKHKWSLSQSSNAEYEESQYADGFETGNFTGIYNTEYHELNNVEQGLTSALGILYTGEHWRWGLQVSQNQTLKREFDYRFSSYAALERRTTDTSNSQDGVVTDYSLGTRYSSVTTDHGPKHPTRVALGSAWQADQTTISVDLIYHSAVRQQTPSDYGDLSGSVQSSSSAVVDDEDGTMRPAEDFMASYDLDRRATLDVAFGWEQVLGNQDIWRWGIFSSRHNVDERAVRRILQQPKDFRYYPEVVAISLWGLTTSYTTTVIEKAEATLGISLAMGKGRAYPGSLLNNTELVDPQLEAVGHVDAVMRRYGAYISLRL